MAEPAEVLVLFASLAFFSFFALRSRSLDRDGILLANALGLAVFVLGGLQAYAVIVLFFVAAEGVTRLARRGRPRHPRRSASNILGNGAAALAALLAGSTPGFFGGVSAALADTLSSEVGQRVAGPTWLLATRKRVSPGTDGGVSAAGYAAAAAGGLLIALAYYALYANAWVAVAVLAAGLAGSTTDSFFGEFFERRRLLSNAQVNFLGSLAGVLVAHAAGVLAP